jgi:GAF domain-containing protein
LLPYLASVVLGFSCIAVAALIVRRKPGDRGVLTIASLLVVVGWSTAGTHVIFESVYPQWQVPLRVLGVTGFGCLTLVLYVFPDGRFVPQWTKWPALVNLLISPLNALDSPINPQRWPVALSTVFALLTLAVPLAAQVYRYRVVSTVQQRQQTKWVGFSVLILSLGSLPIILASWLAPELSAPGPRGLVFHLLSNSWLALLMLLVPLSIAVAVLRLRLWDVDPLLNRTLVYGTLTLLAGTLYILTLGLLGALFQAPDNLVFSLLAAGLIAVLFEPARRALQHSVNRLMYGDRHNPYGVVTRLAERLECAPAPEAVLATIAQTVREAFLVPYAAVELSGSTGRALAVVHDPLHSPIRVDPPRTDQDLRVPLTYQGGPVGSLTVAPRSPGEEFSGHDRRLLDDLGRHAGTALYAVRAATELQLAREIWSAQARRSDADCDVICMTDWDRCSQPSA